MPVPQICAKTPQNSFPTPNVALPVTEEGTLLFAGGVEAKAQAFRVEPGLPKSSAGSRRRDLWSRE